MAGDGARPRGQRLDRQQNEGLQDQSPGAIGAARLRMRGFGPDCTGPVVAAKRPRLSSSMQLPLDIAAAPPARLANFVPGANREALLAATQCVEARLRMLYLWGAVGTGRSHLLQGIGAELPAERVRLLRAASPLDEFTHTPTVSHWLLDDIDTFTPRHQEAAFHLYNAVLASPGAVFVASGDQPPARLATMPELATRLGYGLVIQLHPLGEQDLATALALTLRERGLSASPELIPWLLVHAPRDLGRLRGLIDALDRYALARGRALTVPLLKAFERDSSGRL
jgi:DnaA family protein